MQRTENQQEMDKMRLYIHGSDRGNAILLSLILILSLSLVFLALLPRIAAVNKYAIEYKENVILKIQSENKEIKKRYDIN